MAENPGVGHLGLGGTHGHVMFVDSLFVPTALIGNPIRRRREPAALAFHVNGQAVVLGNIMLTGIVLGGEYLEGLGINPIFGIFVPRNDRGSINCCVLANQHCRTAARLFLHNAFRILSSYLANQLITF